MEVSAYRDLLREQVSTLYVRDSEAFGFVIYRRRADGELPRAARR
jgi:hypothetical protein